MRRWVRFLPLVALGLFVVAVDWRLSNPPSSTIVSRLVGEPFPALHLPAAVANRPALNDQPGDGKPRLVNLFASWCLPCIGEAPVLMELKRRGVTIDGIAVRDKPERVAGFLERNGNPYRNIGADRESGAQLLLGSSGVPETFLVDARGIIRRHQVGPIEEGNVDELVRALEAAR
jgi:cytochrome c biogenesis protein CcmG/thiol:disulfide interchange protein DsbE